jgi:hypothetical protein
MNMDQRSTYNRGVFKSVTIGESRCSWQWRRLDLGLTVGCSITVLGHLSCSMTHSLGFPTTENIEQWGPSGAYGNYHAVVKIPL